MYHLKKERGRGGGALLDPSLSNLCFGPRHCHHSPISPHPCSKPWQVPEAGGLVCVRGGQQQRESVSGAAPQWRVPGLGLPFVRGCRQHALLLLTCPHQPTTGKTKLLHHMPCAPKLLYLLWRSFSSRLLLLCCHCFASSATPWWPSELLHCHPEPSLFAKKQKKTKKTLELSWTRGWGRNSCLLAPSPTPFFPHRLPLNCNDLVQLPPITNRHKILNSCQKRTVYVRLCVSHSGMFRCQLDISV